MPDVPFTRRQRVLAIRMSRSGFEAALGESCLSHFDPALCEDRDAWRPALVACAVRVQWDPERALDGQPLPCRPLQVGLSGSAITRCVTEWIRSIEDITNTLERRRHGLDQLPAERPYPLPVAVMERISATT